MLHRSQTTDTFRLHYWLQVQREHAWLQENAQLGFYCGAAAATILLLLPHLGCTGMVSINFASGVFDSGFGPAGPAGAGCCCAANVAFWATAAASKCWAAAYSSLILQANLIR
jgi:hypothetical protein